MHNYKQYFFVCILLFSCSIAFGQTDTSVTSIQTDLINIFNQKPKKYKIESIKTTGNNYFDESLLISISGINIGDEVTIPGGDLFARAINKIWHQNYFSDVSVFITNVNGNKISIEISVQERPRLSKFLFEHVSKGEKDDLAAKVGLVPGHIVTDNSIISAIEAIKKYFEDKSYYNVSVSYKKVKDSSLNNSTSLVFDVNKGRKVRVNYISFTGNTIDDQKLKKQFRGTKEQSRLTFFPPKDTGIFANSFKYTFNDYLRERGYLTFTKTKKILSPYVKFNYFSSSKFNDKKYEEDKESLIQYYNSQGFRDAVIIKDNRQYNTKGDINLNLKLEEGKQYYFGNISFKGNTKYSDSILHFIVGIKKGDLYNAEQLSKKIMARGADGGDITTLYQDDGYLFFQAKIIETAVYNDTIDHEIKIIEGPQATWKNVKIVGNDKTKEHVIRRELRTIPGEKFSRTDIMRSIRELSQLNYFNPEKIVPDVVPNPEDGTVDITWRLEEKSSDQLELSAGWGGNIGLTGTLGVTFNNFSAKRLFHKSAWDPLPMGDGQRLSLRIQSNGRAFRSYNFSFTEPWLGGKKRNALTFSIYDTKFSNAFNPVTGLPLSGGAESFLQTTGITLALGRQIKWPDDYFSMTTAFNYTLYTLNNYYIDRVNLPGFNNGYANNINFKIGIQRNSLSGNPMFPSGGSNLLFSLQFTPPYSLFDKDIYKRNNPYNFIEYHKWRFNSEWYVPLSNPVGEDRKQLVLKLAAKYGFLGRYNNNLQISPFERFQVGDAGMTNQFALLGFDIISHRGYPVYQNSDPKINPEQTSASQYFTIFNKYTAELRYPLSLSQGSTIYALGFFEAANGWYSSKDYNPFQLRRSVGLGMRFFLPMFGLLGFDYGIGLDRYYPGATIKDMARFTFMLGFESE